MLSIYGLAWIAVIVVAFLPALVGAAMMILRTAMEDRTLQHELAGYAAYTQKTRHRLIPAVW